MAYQVLQGKQAARESKPHVMADGWQRRERLVAHLMALPSLLPFLLFHLIPIGWVVYISFTYYDGFSAPVWAGLANYSALLHDMSWWLAVRNTFVFGVGKLLIELPLALLLAVLLNQKIFGSTWLRTCFFLPHTISMMVMGIIFVFIFQPYQGVLNAILLALHVISAPLDYLGQPTSAMLCLIIVGVWSSVGGAMILLLAGLQSISRELCESAALDGAGMLQQLRYITIPLLGPVLRLVILLSIVGTMRSFDLVKILTDGGPYASTEVMFTYIFRYFFTDSNQIGYGAALGVTASIIIALVALLYFRGIRIAQSFESDEREKW
jgi:raffinose/stachyose/melibiose transport system permease protein